MRSVPDPRDDFEDEDDQPTAPHGYVRMRVELGMPDDGDLAARMPDAVEIGSIVLQAAKALYGPDFRAIEAAGLGPQLHRIVGQVAAAVGLAVSGAIKDAQYGRFS